MKGLNFFISAEDTATLIQYIQSLPVDIYRYTGEPFYLKNRISGKERVSLCVFCCGDPPRIQKSHTGHRWVDQKSDCILLSSNSDFLIPGGISCGSDVTEVQSVYRKIVQYVQKKFIRTFDKAYYIGPHLYQAWKNHAVFFRFYVDAEDCVIPHEQFNFSVFVKEMYKNGFFIIESDGSRHREICAPLDEQAERYLIFYPGAKLRLLFSSILRESDLNYIPTENIGELQVTISPGFKQELLNRDGETHILYHVEDDVSEWMPKGHTLLDFSYFPDSEAITLVHKKTARQNSWQFIVDSRYLEKVEMQKMWECVHHVLHRH